MPTHCVRVSFYASKSWRKAVKWCRIKTEEVHVGKKGWLDGSNPDIHPTEWCSCSMRNQKKKNLHQLALTWAKKPQKSKHHMGSHWQNILHHWQNLKGCQTIASNFIRYLCNTRSILHNHSFLRLNSGHIWPNCTYKSGGAICMPSHEITLTCHSNGSRGVIFRERALKHQYAGEHGGAFRARYFPQRRNWGKREWTLESSTFFAT